MNSVRVDFSDDHHARELFFFEDGHAELWTRDTKTGKVSSVNLGNFHPMSVQNTLIADMFQMTRDMLRNKDWS